MLYLQTKRVDKIKDTGFGIFDYFFDVIGKVITKLKLPKIKILRMDTKTVNNLRYKVYKFRPRILLRNIPQNGADDKPQCKMIK